MPRDGWVLFEISFDVDAGNCWLNLRNEGDDPMREINSVPFSISSNERSETTLGLDAATSAVTQTQATVAETSATTSEIRRESTMETEQSSTVTERREQSTGGGDSGSEDQSDGNAENGELGTGAKAGIGVGVSIGVLGIAAFIGAYLIMRRRKRQQRPPDLGLTGSTAVQASDKQMHQYHHHYATPPHELPSTPIQPGELDGGTSQHRWGGT